MGIEAVLDSSAVLAVLNSEPGSEAVASRLDEAVISAVNLCEVATYLMERGRTEEEAMSEIAALEMRTVDFEYGLASAAAALRSATRHRGLSLGDRACLALGRREGAPVFTADRAWAGLDLGVQIVLIR